MGRKLAPAPAAAAAPSSGNGGILGSGIFGMFGTIVNCNADSNSVYCTIMKVFNLLIVLGIIVFVLYLIYSFLHP